MKKVLGSTAKLSRRAPALTLVAFGLALACGTSKKSVTSASGGCDEWIKMPAGFCAIVFAESAGPVRDMAVRKNGEVFVGLVDARGQRGGVLALRDRHKDGHADIAARVVEGGVYGGAMCGDLQYD